MIARPEELSILRECGQRLAAVLQAVVKVVRPGASTLELDTVAENLIISSGGLAAFKGYRTHPEERPFPASICTSINNEVVHGIPRAYRRLAEGDIIGLDIGMRYPAAGGFITDMAVTVPVGEISAQAQELIGVTRAALAAGIHVIRAGIRMGDLGSAIQRTIEDKGCGVVRDLVGHGTGRHLHEHPYVPNYGTPGDGIVLKEGMVLAIEPMTTIGSPLVMLDDDGWTWRTRDGSLAAHFEHTVAVAKAGAEILTKI
ncbi:MAG: type I methionyl aminopeptidase [Candidatus Sungbacteria bacterium]|uniref:Methionine aminopeptidase n=1 Tax=Candidatus Sungiibacteriota bacterium TaxID=2750080 RepID=A0A932YW83_9BACT|nr:type I methionyl aminopeptidase [Candidatus Sungbacteria bacterium]